MCGLFGVREPAAIVDRDALARARDTMTARGPDDAGLMVRPGLGLAHRRLSVLDLSPLGRMPMSDPSERVWVVFNGEIYNHRALRARLEAAGHRFRGHSDTEVLVYGHLEWGEALFDRIEGMFAVAIWDERSREMTLARDPAGEKPLYFAHTPGARLVFGSTLDAMLAWPGPWRLSEAGVRDYLGFGFVRSPRTLVKGIQKVIPGTWMRFADDGAVARGTFWSLQREQDRASRQSIPDLDQLDATLYEAVTSRMEADVPLGAFLSGGVDSSLVCALMARAGAGSLRTYTIGFDDPRFDESRHARAVARHLGIQNRTQIISEADVLAEIPLVVAALDEPMADYSILPSLAVARLAREDLTVALTGDGADELFGGYRYYSALAAFTWMARVPPAIREKVAHLARLIPDARLRRVLERTRARDAAAFFGRSGFYRGPTASRGVPLLLEPAGPTAPDIVADFMATMTAAKRRSAVEAGMLWDATTTLPEAWLCKVDRAAMCVSLETRAPFLAPSVQRAAAALPESAKVSVSGRKIVLRKLLERYLPTELVNRPKQGFTPPMARWMRGALEPDLRRMADSSALARRGTVRAAGLSQLVDEHVSGRFDHAQLLWAVLLLERWMERRGMA